MFSRRRFLTGLGGILGLLGLGGCTVVNDRVIRVSERPISDSISEFIAAAREYSVVDESLVGPVVMSKYYPFRQNAGQPNVIVSHDCASFGGGPVMNSIPEGRHFEVNVAFDIGFWRGKPLASFAEECRRQRTWQRAELNAMLRGAVEDKRVIQCRRDGMSGSRRGKLRLGDGRVFDFSRRGDGPYWFCSSEDVDELAAGTWTLDRAEARQERDASILEPLLWDRQLSPAECDKIPWRTV